MIEDITHELLGKINPDTHSITLPDDLDRLFGRDVKFEMVKATTVQPISLRYQNF